MIPMIQWVFEAPLFFILQALAAEYVAGVWLVLTTSVSATATK